MKLLKTIAGSLAVVGLFALNFAKSDTLFALNYAMASGSSSSSSTTSSSDSSSSSSGSGSSSTDDSSCCSRGVVDTCIKEVYVSEYEKICEKITIVGSDTIREKYSKMVKEVSCPTSGKCNVCVEYKPSC